MYGCVAVSRLYIVLPTKPLFEERTYKIQKKKARSDIKVIEQFDYKAIIKIKVLKYAEERNKGNKCVNKFRFKIFIGNIHQRMAGIYTYDPQFS